MHSSIKMLQPRYRTRTLPSPEYHHPFHGSCPLTGPCEPGFSPDNVIRDFKITPQAASTWTGTKSSSSTPNFCPMGDTASSLSHVASCGILATGNLPIPNHDIDFLHETGNPGILSEPWNSPGVGSSDSTIALFHGLTTLKYNPDLDYNPGDCQIPYMEDDNSMDFDLDLDFRSDTQVMPMGLTGSVQDMTFTGPHLRERIYYTGRNFQGYDLLEPKAQDSRNNGHITLIADEFTSDDAEYESFMDEYPMPQDAQDIMIAPGQFDQGNLSPVTDAESWICQVPGCGKTFDKRHRFNKHRLSHSRIFRCPFPNCKRRAYQEKDIKTHITAVHHKAKIPCPFEGCPYSRTGPKRGISRKDALTRHLRSHEVDSPQLQDTATT